MLLLIECVASSKNISTYISRVHFPFKRKLQALAINILSLLNPSAVDNVISLCCTVNDGRRSLSARTPG